MNVIYFGLTIFTAVPSIMMYILERKFKRKLGSCKPVDKSNYEAMFVVHNYECKQHIIRKMMCDSKCSYKYLCDILEFLNSATKTINLCICMVTLLEVQNLLIEANNRGIRVQIITDFEMSGNQASKISYLTQNGIPIKVQPKHYQLHHKFCLVDEYVPQNAKLFTGSLNLTLQALTSNFETSLFTDNKKIIKSFSDEFEYLWSNFKTFETEDFPDY